MIPTGPDQGIGPDPQLEALLRARATTMPWPETPDVVAGALRALGRGPAAARRGWGSPRRAVLLALLAMLLVAGIVGAAVLGLPGLRIGVVETLPPGRVVEDPLELRRILGVPVTLEEADARLGGLLQVPASLGRPDEVRVGPEGQAWVALIYVADEGALALTGDIGTIVTAWRGELEEAYLQKWVRVGTGEVTAVIVAGHPGYWIRGAPHVLEVVDEGSGIRRSQPRLVGDVLVWQVGDIVQRIESPLGLDRTLAIAESMAPGGSGTE
jgi:hypothetical protein